MKLRAYQQEAIGALWTYLATKNGNPLVVIPTGGGKSHVIGQLALDVFDRYPDERVLCVTHVKELVEQNAEKLRGYCGKHRVGIYSAGLGRRDASRAVTVAGIQSVYRKAKAIGPVGLIIIDECHRVPTKGVGMYRRFLDEMLAWRPAGHTRIVGLSATPYRLKSGFLHEGDDRIFTDIAYEVGIRRLIDEGFLSPLRSKSGITEADLSGVHTRGGEYVASELESAMDKEALISGALDEVQKFAADRKKLLFFCAGVKHAKSVTEALRERGVSAELVTGKTPNGERDRIIRRFKAGKFRALVNVSVLTTGFDAPDIDCLVMLRPTKSTGLYVQMVGRGTRIAPSKTDCLVLDFAGNITRHGPIDAVNVEGKDRKRKGQAPVRVCPGCRNVLAIQLLECPECGHTFDPPKAKPTHETRASEAKILTDDKPARDIHALDVQGIGYSKHEKEGKPPSIRVEYKCGLQWFREWVCLWHGGFAGRKAAQWWRERGGDDIPATIEDALVACEHLRRPSKIVVDVAERFPRVISYQWDAPELEATG